MVFNLLTNVLYHTIMEPLEEYEELEEHEERLITFLKTFRVINVNKEFTKDDVMNMECFTRSDQSSSYYAKFESEIQTDHLRCYKTKENDYIVTSNPYDPSELYEYYEWTQIESIHRYTYTYVKIFTNHKNIIENAKKISDSHIPKYIQDEYINKLKYSHITVYLKDNNYYIISNSYYKYNDEYMNNGWKKTYDCDWAKNYNDNSRSSNIYGTVYAKVIPKK